MPKLSGVDTFQRLREVNKITTPIVALTANAVTGMKEKYLSIGFNDYLAKPINKNELNEIIYKYLGSNDSSQIDFGELPKEIYKVGNGEGLLVPEDYKESSLDLNKFKEQGIDVDSGIELLGDKELYVDTMKEFMQHSDERMNQLTSYKDSNDMENYAIEVHALKSDSKYLGLKALAELAYQHELKSKENDIQYIQEHFKFLEKEYQRVMNILRK